MLISFFWIVSSFSQTNPADSYATPGGYFDKVIDRFGNSYNLTDIKIDNSINPGMSGTVLVSPIKPINDNLTYDTGGNLISPTGVSVYNVLSNDLRIINCAPPAVNTTLTLSSVTLTGSSTTPTAYFTVTTNGNVLPSTVGGSAIPVGSYVLTYTVCDNTYPSICNTVQVNIQVVAPSSPLAETTPPPSTTVSKAAASSQTSFCPCSGNICFNDINLKNRLVGDNGVARSVTDIPMVTVDTDGDGEISITEANEVGYLNLYSTGSVWSTQKISDLTGLECFSNLNLLTVGYNTISIFNLPQNFRAIALQYNPISNFNAILVVIC